MASTDNRAWAGDPVHGILDNPSQYEIVALELRLLRPDAGEPYLDLEFESAACSRTLRFWSPRSLKIEEGGPSTVGMIILDVSARQLEGIGVRVDDYEGLGGGITFVARAVEILHPARVK